MIRVVPSFGLIGLLWLAYASIRIRSWRPILRATALAFAFGILAGGLAFPILLSRYRGTSSDMGYPPWEFIVTFLVLLFALFGMTFGIGMAMVLRATWITNETIETADLMWIYKVSRVAGWILMVLACSGFPLVFFF